MINKKILSTIIFFFFTSFLSGICFLFFVNVPLEAMMTKLGLGQKTIDFIMTLFIILWFIIAVTITVLYYKFIVNVKKRRALQIFCLVIIIALSAVVFYMLLTENTVLQAFQGKINSESERFTFGPYPEESKLLELKEAGYDGVITLLNLNIPFEKILLEKELVIGEKIGLNIHSFPMLPWISENNDALKGIRQLLKNNTGRYYVHCYLGKHRVNLVKQIIEKEFLNSSNHKYVIFKDTLERGEVLLYQNGKIILGSYPTDEEWFDFLLRGNIKEVISYLNPEKQANIPLIEKEKKICQDNGLRFKLFPINKNKIELNRVKELLDNVIIQEDNIFIHGFKKNEVSVLIDSYLRTGAFPLLNVQIPQMKAGSVYDINKMIYLGPETTTEEAKILKQHGIKKIVEIFEPNQATVVQKANQIEESIQFREGLMYFWGFQSDKEMQKIKAILENRFYGENFKVIPDALLHHKVTLINHRLAVGLKPEKNELYLLAEHGVKTIILITGRDAEFDKNANTYKQAISDIGLNLRLIEYGNNYLNKIIIENMKDNNRCYVVTPNMARVQITQDILNAKY